MSDDQACTARSRIDRVKAFSKALDCRFPYCTLLQVMHYYKDNLMAFKKGDWLPEEDAALLRVPASATVLIHCMHAGHSHATIQQWLRMHFLFSLPTHTVLSSVNVQGHPSVAPIGHCI